MASRTNNLFLIGPMGSGKTAVGKHLARLLRAPFRDSDAEIEHRTGVDISYIFSREGEDGFRQREREVIEDVTRESPIVLATGGGAILLPENRAALHERGFVVYTDERDTLVKGFPDLKNRAFVVKVTRLFRW